MHEYDYTARIVDAVLAELRKYPSCRPNKVRVRVGEMLHLVAESVQAHYASLTRGTDLDRVELELEEVPARLRCLDCQSVAPPEDHHLLLCPGCGSRHVKLLSGDDIEIQSIELSR